MEIVVGTYEELLLGYRLVKTAENYILEQSFTDHSHIGSVRTVASSPKGVLASGGSDETIRLFNLISRTELGNLMKHEGTITDLNFFDKSHMFSTSEDGSICIWKTGRWECVRTLRGHKGPVYGVSVHPSGKLALSISKDKTLRTWNLLTGKRAYITNIKQVADKVLWTPDGEKYMVVFDRKIDVYQVETGTVWKSIASDLRIHAVAFYEDYLLLGGDDGRIAIYNMNLDRVYEFSTDTNRVKDIVVCQCPYNENGTIIVTASSDGFIKLWNVNRKKEDVWNHRLLTEIDTKFRLICVTAHIPAVKAEKDIKPSETDVKIENSSGSEESSDEESETKREKPTKKKHKQEQIFTSKEKKSAKKQSSLGKHHTPSSGKSVKAKKRKSKDAT